MDAFHRLSQLSMKERASLIWQSAAQLVEDALSKLLGNNMLFLDRHDAGKQLAERLLALKDENPVVLALPRGGVSVGFEVVRVLAAPLDLVVVGKIGAPFEAELAIGAIADGADPELVTDPLFIAGLDISPVYFEESKAAVLREIERRRQVYLGNRPPLEVAGRTVIIVDDGIATGATMLAALRATRRRRPARIVLAVPVASKATLKRLREEADQIVCVATPRNLGSVGKFYQQFPQLRDTEVTELLDKARNFVSSTRAGGALMRRTALLRQDSGGTVSRNLA